jgi:hypothetical protein
MSRQPPSRPRRPLAIVVAALAVALAVPVAAWAAEWNNGDVFVGLNTGMYNVYDNGGNSKDAIDQSLGAGRAGDCAFDGGGVLHTPHLDANSVVRFQGAHPHGKLANIPTGTAKPESISFARDGTFYVGHQANPNSLRRFTGDGAPIAPAFTPFHPASMLDLSADQRTMFYASRSGAASQTQVHRYDVSAGTDMPDFADLGGTAAANGVADLKLLPPGDGSGGLIVARTSDIKRLDGGGNVVRTYDVFTPAENSWFGIALDPDGSSFWATSSTTGNVYRFNMHSGASDRGPIAAANGAFGICVKGTRTAALDNAPPQTYVHSPGHGSTFFQGDVVLANYGCPDDPHGVGTKSCVGPVPFGERVDTSSVGVRAFTVFGEDLVGNRSSATSSFTVIARPVTPPPPPPPVIRVTVSFSTLSSARFTVFRELVVRNVPRGSRVTVTCKTKRGRKCRRVKTFTKRNARGSVRIRSMLRKRIPVGSVIEVRVTKPGFTGAVKRVLIRRKKVPTTTERCLPQGATRPVRC